MKTILFVLLITFISISCSENKTVNEAPLLYNISGKIETNSYNESVQNLLVTLISSNKFETYTDSLGNFYFNDIQDGEYQINVRDNSVMRIDTTVTINSTINLILQLNELLIDYIPFRLNSTFTYEFVYYPYGSSEYVQRGTLIWKVLNEDITNKRCQIQEIFEGIEIISITNVDTANFGPDTSLTEFITIDDLWMQLNLSFLEISHNNSTLEIKKYYPKNWSDEVTIANEPDFIDYEPDEYIHSIENFHRIRLRKNFGIVYWHCGGISNGAKNFTLTLIE